MLGVPDAQNRRQAGMVSSMERNHAESCIPSANPRGGRIGCHAGGGAGILAARMGGPAVLLR
ncbi:unnamed protein product [Symbiodinium pilosum]|uniref:Uncharacterized protein n=1 Tax=Symbiodinium pilosum TaxID=2952 RepID=A0A812S1T5_SYMPI|nr:unnamed protein product [Symbiodinium pilosum]